MSMTDPHQTQRWMNEAITAEKGGNLPQARATLQKVVEQGPPEEALDARSRLGRLLIQAGPAQFAAAEQVLEEARAQAQQLSAIRKEAVAVHLLALLALKRRDPDRAWGLLEQSPVQRITSAPGPSLGQWFHYKGLVAQYRADLNLAERMFFRAHQVYAEVRHDAGLAEVDDSLAGLLMRRGKPELALEFAQHSLALKQRDQDRYGEAITLGTIGRIHVLQGRYHEAEKAFQEDLRLARSLGDAAGVGIMLNSLGEAARLDGDPGRSLDWHKQALTHKALGPLHLAFAQIGAIRALLEHHPPHLNAAREHHAQLVQVVADLEDGHWFHDVVIGLRGSIAALGDGDPAGLARAEEDLLHVVAALQRRQFGLDTIPFLLDLRDLLIRLERKPEAVAAMAQALERFHEAGSRRGLDESENWLREVDQDGLTRLALSRHFPEFVIDQVVKGRMGPPESRVQPVAVLFSDVRGFTALTEGLGAEQIVRLLNEWFSEATRVVRRHHGYVDKFIGDAVMALFGVPECADPADAARDALRAAWELRETLAAINLRHQALGRPELAIGVGVDVGDAVVGFMGSNLRESYSAVGSVVNTAARLESATKDQQCEVLISDRVEAAQRSREVAETEFVGMLELKGLGQPLGAYKVLGLKPTA